MKLRKTLVALGAAATLTLTACGSATDSTDGESSSGSSTVSGNASAALTADNFASSVSDAQADARSTHMELSMDFMGQHVDGSGDVEVPESEDPKDAKMAMVLEIPSMGEIDMRLVDGVAYLKMGSMTQNKFVEMDLTKGDNPLGKSLDDMTQQADPNAMVEQLAGSLKDFEKTDETEEIDGVEATKYVLTIDGDELKGMMGGSAMSGGGSMPKEVVADVWIGDDDLLRKMSMEMEASGTPVSLEMTFTDWGEPVDVEAPSDDEITDSSMFDGMTM